MHMSSIITFSNLCKFSNDLIIKLKVYFKSIIFNQEKVESEGQVKVPNNMFTEDFLFLNCAIM